jgi:hypothetical protein
VRDKEMGEKMNGRVYPRQALYPAKQKINKNK